MESRRIRLKKKHGRVWDYQDIIIPTDEEMDRIAAKLHAKRKPALIDVLGWQVFYSPSKNLQWTATKVDPLSSTTGDTVAHRSKTISYCVFGYGSPDWQVCYSWNRGNHQPPTKRQEKGDILTLEVGSEELDAAMLAGYKKAGEETGYWGNYFLRSIRQHGGLATARRMLRKRMRSVSEQTKGFHALIDAGRVDLTLESLVLQPQFKSLFTKEEIAEAKRRLEMVPDYARRVSVPPNENYPDDIRDGKKYSEGAKKRITVNAYERDPKAREACLKRHGYRCAVCAMSFHEVYGDIGKHFIHVHHKKPLAARRTDYIVSPTIDLVPVCPNCHAMLHTSSPPLGVVELKEKMQRENKLKGLR